MSRETPTSARVGWAIFLASGCVTSREAINDDLAEGGLPPISARMFDHSTRLSRHGVGEYMPINELDISVKHGLLEKRGA